MISNYIRLTFFWHRNKEFPGPTATNSVQYVVLNKAFCSLQNIVVLKLLFQFETNKFGPFLHILFIKHPKRPKKISST